MWIKRHRSRALGDRGFTLMEILVAMSIFAIVMGLIFGTFEGVFSSADHVNTAGEIYEMADACVGRISQDLQSIHVLQTPRYQKPDMDSEPDIYRVTSKNESMGSKTFSQMRFTTLAHLPIGGDIRDGIAEIVYYVQEVENNVYALRRSDKLYPYPEFEPKESDPILCEKLLGFTVLFYDQEGREREEWQSDDDDFDYSTPGAVKITLKIGTEEAPYEFGAIISLPMRRFISAKR